MSSKMIYRSCGSSIRTLINRHIRPTVAAPNIQTESPGIIYNWHYLLPNSFAPQPVSIGHGFGRDAAGYSVSARDVSGGLRKFEAAKSNFEEESIDEEDDDDEIEYEVSDVDHDDYDSEDDEHLVTDDD